MWGFSVTQSRPSLWDPMDCSMPRPPGPSLSPEVYPSSCPLHQWCHPVISFSDTLFCRQSTPASETFPMSWLFTSDDQNIGASASASVLPMSIQGWFPLRLTGLISLLCKGLSGVFSSTTVWRHHFFVILPSLWSRGGKALRAELMLTGSLLNLLNLDPISCSIQGCFLTHIQVSQETGKMVWYSHLFKSFPQFVMIHR